MNQDPSPLTSEESTRLIGQSTKPRRSLAENQSFFESIRSVDVRTWLFIYANVCLVIYNSIGIATLIFLGSPWTLIGCVIASVNWGFLIFAAVSKKVWPLKSSKTIAEFQRAVLLFCLFALLVFTVILLFVNRTQFDGFSKPISRTILGAEAELSILPLTIYSLLACNVLTLDMYLRVWLIKESLEAVEIDVARKARLLAV